MKPTFPAPLRHLVLAALLLALTVGAMPARAAPPSQRLDTGERRVALLIGNNAYPDAPLTNCLNDADDMAQVLSRLGFETRVLHDADLRQMRQALERFGKAMEDADVALFYYSGHGMGINERNYMIPVDSVTENERAADEENVPVQDVLQLMAHAAPKVGIVLLDACRSNPFASQYRSMRRGYVKMEAPIGTLIGFATAPGKIARETDGRNSVYTKHLLAHIATPGLSITDLFIRVRNDVILETERRQIPWENSCLTQNFYFSPVDQAQTVAAMPGALHEQWRDIPPPGTRHEGEFVSAGDLFVPLSGGAATTKPDAQAEAATPQPATPAPQPVPVRPPQPSRPPLIGVQ